MASQLSSRNILRQFSSSKTVFNNAPKKTVLCEFHKQHGGKMVDFAGWLMPVQYKALGISASHHHTRNKASLFDVSHMLQTKIYGKDKVDFVESLVVGDVKSLSSNGGTLSLFTNETGGILDDLIVNNTEEDHLYLVSNAGCSDKIQSHLKDHLSDFKGKGGHVDLEHIDNGLLALQGPSMVEALQPGIKHDLAKLPFMSNIECSVFGIDGCRVTRCGYTGEDGVEISVPHHQTVQLAETLLNHPSVELAGLGARDTLRLEAGLCLYGNDIDETTTPVEATLLWCVGKRRRKEANFPGAEAILAQIKEKPKRKRVGLVISGPIARHGAKIEDDNGDVIGEVTSGCPSPSLSKNIAMAYVATKHSKIGSTVSVKIRNKNAPAVVTKMPFVPANYYFVK